MALTVTFLQFSKRINSTKQPTAEQLEAGVKYDNVTLKTLTNIDNPVLYIDGANLNLYAYNYCYIHDWGRYYFVKTASLRHERIFECVLVLDDLATFKTAILNTSAYVIYSSSEYNRWLKDDRVPILPRGTSLNLSDSIKEWQTGNIVFSATHQDQVCIVSVNNKDFGLTHYVMHESDLTDIMAALSAAGTTVWGSLAAQFGAAIQSIIQIIRLPINDSVLPLSANQYQFILGDQIIAPADPSQPAFAFYILTNTYIRAKASVGIPAGYVDFRLCEPYQQIKVSLPFVGTIDVNIADYREDGAISFRIAIDLLTGAICYENDINEGVNKPFASYAGQCGTLIPFVSSQIQNSASIVQNTVHGLTSLGLSAITANPIPAVVGGISAIAGAFYASNQKATSIIGSYSGNRSDVLLTSVKCTMIKYDTLFEPSELTALEGRPCCKVVSLLNLTGYCRTQNFSIDLNANKDVIDSINSKLDAGIYIE